VAKGGVNIEKKGKKTYTRMGKRKKVLNENNILKPIYKYQEEAIL